MVGLAEGGFLWSERRACAFYRAAGAKCSMVIFVLRCSSADVGIFRDNHPVDCHCANDGGILESETNCGCPVHSVRMLGWIRFGSQPATVAA